MVLSSEKHGTRLMNIIATAQPLRVNPLDALGVASVVTCECKYGMQLLANVREQMKNQLCSSIYIGHGFGAVDCKQKPDVCRVHITLRVYVLDVLRVVQFPNQLS